MRPSRLLVLISMSSVLAIAGACGGDDNGGGSGNDGGASDASTSDASGGDSGGSDASESLQAKANDVDVYLLQIATLDATASTPSGATFSWQLARAPAGSVITTASIANATTATPSFVPDVLGTYTLALKVTSGAASATKNVNVRAFAGKLFVSHVQDLDGGTHQSDVLYAPTVGGDGGAATVSCETTYFPTFSNGGGTMNAPFGFESLPGALDWQEGAPADEAKVAFGFREVAPDGGFSNYLAIGTSSSTCDTIKKLDTFVNVGDVPQAVRISPNGDRVAFVRQNGSTIDIATVGLDGSNLRVLGSLFRNSDGGTGTSPAFSFLKRRLQWTDETHVAWVSDSSEVVGDFTVVVANDSATPNPADYMDCNTTDTSDTDQADVVEFALLPSGVVLVTGVITEVDAGGSGIYALRPNASTKRCELVGQIGSGGSIFSISPDGSRIATTMPDTDAGLTALFVAPLDGGAPVEVRSNDAGVGAGVDFGPQWVQGGTALALTVNAAFIDGGSVDNVVVVPAAGGPTTPVAFSSLSQDEFLTPTNGWTCSIGTFGSATPAAGIFLSLGLLLLRRRKNEKKKRVDS